MTPAQSSFEDVLTLIQDRRERFVGLYSTGIEGILQQRTLHKTGEKVFLWTSRIMFKGEAEESAIRNRLSFLVESGVFTLPVIEYGLDSNGVAFLFTQWKEVEQVSHAKARGLEAPDLFIAMVSTIERLHSGGMPFGDLTEDSFLIDSKNMLELVGIPAFGFPIPLGAKSEEFTPVDRIDEKAVPFTQDVWGLGVYAHRLFLGTPFVRPATKKQLEIYMAEKLPALIAPLADHLPPWVEPVLNSTLVWDPSERVRVDELSGFIQEHEGFAGKVALFFSGLKDIFSSSTAGGGAPAQSNLGRWIVLGGGGAFLCALLVLQFGPSWFTAKSGDPRPPLPAFDPPSVGVIELNKRPPDSVRKEEPIEVPAVTPEPKRIVELEESVPELTELTPLRSFMWQRPLEQFGGYPAPVPAPVPAPKAVVPEDAAAAEDLSTLPFCIDISIVEWFVRTGLIPGLFPPDVCSE